MIKSALWTQKEKDKAIKMVNEGHTAREISDVLKRTRNSIIGFIHRSGISFSSTNPSHRPTVKPLPKKRSKPLPKPTPEPKISLDIKFVKLFEARYLQCKAIIDKPDDVWETVVCGKPVHKSSWCCKFHHSIYYQKLETRKRAHVQ